MKDAALSFVLTLVLLLGGFAVLRTGRFSRAQTNQAAGVACCGPDRPEAPREVDFPYYSLRDGFESTLLLVSDSPKPTDLTLAIRSLTGETVLTHMTIQPQAKLPVDLRKLLTELGADPTGAFAEGSVSVYFIGTIMPVVGQLTMTNPARRLVHESEMVENDPGRSDIPAVLNGLWWGLAGGRDGRVMVSNMSGDLKVADVFLDFGGKQHPSAPLVFNPHETKVLSIPQLLADINVSVSEAPEGGITVIQRGAHPALIAQGKVTDSATGFSTTLEFPDPARQHASAVHASGIPIGTPTKDSPFRGVGTFTPHVIVRNTLGAPQSIRITVEYPTGAYTAKGPERYNAGHVAKEFDGEAGEGTGTLSLGPFSVGAYSTQDISLDAAVSQLPQPLPYCSIRARYSGPPGSVIAEVVSVDETHRGPRPALTRGVQRPLPGKTL